MNTSESVWGIIPAAGVGKRVGAAIPKQYLELHGKSVLTWTIERLLGLENIKSVIVAISDGDEYWPELPISSHSRVQKAVGGAERCYSVLSSLNSLSGKAGENDWVLVHDAARPCVRTIDILKLLEQCRETNNGGILAMPVRDTMKQANNTQNIESTLDRSTMWHALTPQCFRYSELKSALNNALEDGFEVTDEASAMEYAGQKPQLVEGHSDNIKITMPEDVSLASYFLQQQDAES